MNNNNPMMDALMQNPQFVAYYNQCLKRLNGRNPEEVVRNLMSSGQASQELFEQGRQFANNITGKNL